MTKNLITRMNKKLAPLRAKNDVTHAIQLKLHEQKVAVTSYGRNKNHDEIKKHSRTSPDVQFKEFSLTKQKTRPRTDYEWIGKII